MSASMTRIRGNAAGLIGAGPRVVSARAGRPPERGRKGRLRSTGLRRMATCCWSTTTPIW